MLKLRPWPVDFLNHEFFEPIWSSRSVGEVKKIVPVSECESGGKKRVPTLVFLWWLFSLHRSIHHPGNQVTMAL